MKIFTDIDLDGLGCGVIAQLAYGEEADVSYVSHRFLNQRVEQFIDNPNFAKEETFITDMAVNDSVEKKLAKRFNEGGHIRLIDHHVTAMHFNQYEWGTVQPDYEDGKKTCATSLFYDYLIKIGKIERTTALDEFVDLVRQYDTWEWDENNTIAAKRLNDLFYIMERSEFEEGILSRLQEAPDSFSLTETENYLLDVEENKIVRYIRSKNRQLVQTFIDEYCAGIIHAEQYLSELGNELNKLNPHLDMIILLNTGGKKAGFRTIHDHVDVSEFASRFGGGGHPKASGCELSQEAFEKFVVDVFPLPPIKPDPDRNELNVKGAPYGTCFENRKGDSSFVLPAGDEKFEVIHNGKKIGQEFDSFEKAERYIKRQFGSWLRYDNDLVRLLSKALPLTPEEVREKYPDIVHLAGGQGGK